MSGVPARIRRRIRQRARGMCEYCRSFESNTGHDFTVDHVFPGSKGGGSDLANLCLCCFWCNDFKGAQTQANDPRTGNAVRLFNPRTDDWKDHFRWSPAGTRLVGLTATGRATIHALRLNRPTLVRARGIWARYGLHPSEGDQ